ncbi:MAG: VanZ family protein [Cellvibrionaceae bacterium]
MKITTSVNESFNDLVSHFLAYMALMCSGLLAFPHRMYIAKLFTAFLIYSIFIECIQYFLPYRSFSLLDMIANAAGLLVGISAGVLLIPIFRSLHAYK